MRHTDIPTDSQPLASMDAAAGTARGGAAYVADMERRLAPYCARAEPRQHAMDYLRGLLSPAERKNSWQVAEVSGEPTPSGFQHLRGRADWEPEAVRDELRWYVLDHLREPDAVLVIDETGVRKKGLHSAGVARQYRGTAGKVENGQIGVLLAYASRLGHVLLDRERSRPKAWTDDRARCRQAGVPQDRRFATKPQLAQQMLARALGAGVPATWVTGDSVYGDDRRRRRWLEGEPQAYGLAVSGKAYGWRGGCTTWAWGSWACATSPVHSVLLSTATTPQGKPTGARDLLRQSVRTWPWSCLRRSATSSPQNWPTKS